MRNALLLALALIASACPGLVAAQHPPGAASNHDITAAAQELHAFYDAYADDLRLGRREAIAARYHPGGYHRLGDGKKAFVAFDDVRTGYLTTWTPPQSFAWKDLSFEIVSKDGANVVGLFDWQEATGERTTASYSALLVKHAERWVIRVEDESFPQVLYTVETLSGDLDTAGPYSYRLTAQPTGSIAAHRHSSAMKVNVVSGRKLILMGDLDTASVQIFEAGSTFVIPAGTWHVEWWETETVEDIEVTAPMKTERATPATPRVN